ASLIVDRLPLSCVVFFFQAEDGIRDGHVTGVQTCALPICQGAVVAEQRRLPPVLETLLGWLAPLGQPVAVALEATLYWAWLHDRSEERRVGKECRSGWWPDH